MKFNVVVCDPPYGFSDKLAMSDVKRGAQANYNTMTIQQIKSIRVKDIVDPNGAILALWVPSSLLQDGLDIMKEYGFNFKQTYIWVKIKKDPFINFKKWIKKDILKSKQTAYDKILYNVSINNIIDSLKNINLNSCCGFGMGRLFRQCHEICLIGTNNNKIYKLLQNKSQRSVSFAENLKHSTKPENLQDSLDMMFSDKSMKIEIFSRKQRAGWWCIGNESAMTENEDIEVSLNKLKNISENEMFPINKLICCYDDGKQQNLFEMWKKIS